MAIFNSYVKLPDSTGWWYTYPSEKYESQLVSLFPIIDPFSSRIF